MTALYALTLGAYHIWGLPERVSGRDLVVRPPKWDAPPHTGMHPGAGERYRVGYKHAAPCRGAKLTLSVNHEKMWCEVELTSF